MKKIIVLLTLLAFVAGVPMAMAAAKAKEEKINCCVKGKCKKMTEKKCEAAKGEVVVDCKDCKKPEKPAKPAKTKPESKTPKPKPTD